MDIAGWTRDLRAALDHLYNLDRVDRTRLCLLGFSGGAEVSVYTAAHDPRVSSAALCACPADFRSQREKEPTANTIEWFRQIGVIRDPDFPSSVEEWERGFDVVTPGNWIDRISSRSVLLVHGDADELLPLEHSYRLYDKARDPKELRVIPSAGHRLRIEETAMAAVLDWLKARCLIGGAQ